MKYKPIENHYIQLDIAFATEYGVNEALIFDKLYRLKNKWQGHTDDNGNKWIRLTYEEWERELPFLSRSTIRRTLEDMTEKSKLIFSTVFKGRSKWYRLNPELIDTHLPKMSRSSAQNEHLPNSLPNIPLSSSKEEDSTHPQNSSNKKDKSPIKETSFKEKVSAPRPAAVDVYRDVAHQFPHKTLWSMIDEKIGTDPADLEYWGQIIFNYIACGWYKGSIKAMIEFFERREIPSVNQKGNGKTANVTQPDQETIKLHQEVKELLRARGL